MSWVQVNTNVSFLLLDVDSDDGDGDGDYEALDYAVGESLQSEFSPQYSPTSPTFAAVSLAAPTKKVDLSIEEEETSPPSEGM